MNSLDSMHTATLEIADQVQGDDMAILPKRKLCRLWYWHCLDSKLEDTLRMVLPYLIVKRREALLALAFRKAVAARYGRRRLTQQQLARQESCWRRMAALKYASGPSRKSCVARNGVE
jgi:hypothetical protein